MFNIYLSLTFLLVFGTLKRKKISMKEMEQDERTEEKTETKGKGIDGIYRKDKDEYVGDNV